LEQETQEKSSGAARGYFHLKAKRPFICLSLRAILNAHPLPIYTYQEEKLIPLIVFPDEVAIFHDYTVDDRGISKVTPEERRQDFIELVEEKIKRKVTDSEMHGIRNNLKFLLDAYSNWKLNLDNPESRMSCGKLFN
jgi:hypothetical protein